MKFRRDRRPGCPIEGPFVFYPRLLGEPVVKARGYWSVYRRFKAIMHEVRNAFDRATYTDLAIAPPRDQDGDTLDLYHATRGGAAALARKRHAEAIRAGT